MPEYIKTTGGYFYKTYKNGKSVRVSKDEYDRNNKIVGGGWNPFSWGTTKSTRNNRGSLQRQKGFKGINPIPNMRHIQTEEWHNNNNNRGSSSEFKFNLKPKQTIVNNFIQRSNKSKSIAQNAQNGQNNPNEQQIQKEQQIQAQNSQNRNNMNTKNNNTKNNNTQNKIEEQQKVGNTSVKPPLVRQNKFYGNLSSVKPTLVRQNGEKNLLQQI
jgi:hypothetical protein